MYAQYSVNYLTLHLTMHFIAHVPGSVCGGQRIILWKDWTQVIRFVQQVLLPAKPSHRPSASFFMHKSWLRCGSASTMSPIRICLLLSKWNFICLLFLFGPSHPGTWHSNDAICLWELFKRLGKMTCVEHLAQCPAHSNHVVYLGMTCLKLEGQTHVFGM